MADDLSDTVEEINLLLLGRTGNGKSSTGNSILGGKEFTPQSCTSSVVTYDVKAAAGSVKGVPVRVVEGPGLGDTDIDVTDDGQSMIGLSQKAMSLSSHRFHALLVVLKYGVRFTNQEKEAVRMIKTIFGEDVINHYGIMVMTYGDSFDLDMESEGVTFETWCDDQTGDFRDLFDECDNRCVLFDNKSKETGKVEKQREQLLNLVADIMQCRPPYSDDDYLKAEPSRRSLLVYSKLPELDSKTEFVISKVNKHLDQVKKQQKVENINDLQKLFNELREHKSWLEQEDGGTGLIKHLLVKISIAETRIKSTIEIEKKTEELQREKSLRKEDISRRTQSAGQEDKQSSHLSMAFYSHWKSIYLLISVILHFTPRSIKIVPFIIERLFGVYTILWSILLPSKVMRDKRLVDVINATEAKLNQF